MRDKKSPRYPAEGIAMSLNKLLFTDNESMQALLGYGVAASDNLIQLLRGDHAYSVDGTKIVTIHNVLNYILDANKMGVLYVSTTNACSNCFRIHPNPKEINPPCPCGGVYQAVAVTGFIPAELREPRIPNKPIGPPLFYALAELLVKKYVPPATPSVNMIGVASTLQALLNLFVVHGDIDEDEYLIEVLQKDKDVFYRLISKSEMEEQIKTENGAGGATSFVIPEA